MRNHTRFLNAQTQALLQRCEKNNVTDGSVNASLSTTPSHEEVDDAESLNVLPKTETFGIFHCNLDGFKTNSVKVLAELERLDNLPELVLLNETKYDEGDGKMTLAGYKLVCKKDRDCNGGGIAIFGREDKASRFSQLELSARTSALGFSSTLTTAHSCCAAGTGRHAKVSKALRNFKKN